MWTPLSPLNVCIELIDGEDESNPREKPEETTTVTEDALRWSTMLRLGGIDGNPVLRGTRRRTKYAYMSSN